MLFSKPNSYRAFKCVRWPCHLSAGLRVRAVDTLRRHVMDCESPGWRTSVCEFPVDLSLHILVGCCVLSPLPPPLFSLPLVSSSVG